MPATTTSLGFSITITNVRNKSFEADFRLNVKKRIAKIVYLESPTPDAVRLSYSGSNEINVENTLFIGDRSDRLYPNSKDRMRGERVVSGNVFGVEHQELLCTQKFAERTGDRVPLYYKHVLPAHIDLDSVKILNKNFEELSRDHWRVELIKEYDEDTGEPIDPPNYLYAYVFNSQESYFDELTGDYEVFYIQYMDDTNTVYTVLLNNEQAYTKATLDDVWFVTNKLKPWCHAYILDSSFILTMPAAPGASVMAIRYTAKAKIEVIPPALTNDTSPWFPRVTNGAFSWAYDDYLYTYEIPEFTTQSFNPYEPYKMTDRALAMKITSSLLKLPHEHILVSDFARSLSMVIEENNEVIKAITLDSSLVGSRYTKITGEYVKDIDGNYIVWSDSEILSMDNWTGILQMNITIKDYWKIWCSYTYQETHFEVSRINMNPVFDREIHRQIRVMYLVPRAAPNANFSQTSSIQYLKVGPGGTIEETSQDGSSGNPDIAFDVQRGDPDAYSIIGVVGLHYSWRASTSITDDFIIGPGRAIPVISTEKFPSKGWVRFLDNDVFWRYVKYIKKTDTSLVLSDEDNDIPDALVNYELDLETATIELVNFIDQYTTSSCYGIQREKDYYGLDSELSNIYSQYFILADLSINPPHGIHDAALVDVREDGGGIFPELYDEAKSYNPEVQWYYDFLRYDGQPTPGNAVAVIKVPKKLLRTFTEDQVKEIVENNIPLGIKPIVKYYGYQPEIISIATLPNGLLLCWEPMGPEFTYDIWYALNSEGPWRKHNEIRLTDDSLGQYNKNCYLIDDLDSGRVYYTKVTCHDKYEAYWCSYDTVDSVSGGLMREDDPPEPPFGNSVGFKVSVI